MNLIGINFIGISSLITGNIEFEWKKIVMQFTSSGSLIVPKHFINLVTEKCIDFEQTDDFC